LMGLLHNLRMRRRRMKRSPDPGPVLPHRVPEHRESMGVGFAVVDVETTGLDVRSDRVVEIAVIHTDAAGRVDDEWTTLLNPCGPVGATHIHGITPIDVRRAPRFAEVIGELNARLAGRALVAHNVPFDMGFIQMEYARAGWPMPPARRTCARSTRAGSTCRTCPAVDYRTAAGHRVFTSTGPTQHWVTLGPQRRYWRPISTRNSALRQRPSTLHCPPMRPVPRGQPYPVPRSR